MFKKISILIIGLFFLSGCDVTYNLEITDDFYTEKTTIVENNVSLFNSNQVEKQFYNNYTSVPIPMSKNTPIPTNFDGNESSDSGEEGYYEAVEITNSSRIGMEYKGVFNSNNIADSRFINDAAPKSVFKVNDDSIVISSKTLEREFKQIPALNEITVNIKVNDYLVVKNNADKKINNTYTWNINKDNCANKSIELKISKLSITKYAGSKTGEFINAIKNRETIILALIVVIFISLIYFFIKTNQDKKNKF